MEYNGKIHGDSYNTNQWISPPPIMGPKGT